MAWKKPKWVQKAQTAASNVAKPVVQAVTPPPAPKVMQNIQKAADKVGNVIKPAAQAVAKEAGYVVNPIAGEVAFRAKELAKNPDVVKAGNAIANKVINPITTSAPVKAIQQSAQQAPAKAIQAIQNAVQRPSNENTNFEFMPYFTKKLPDAVGDVVRGTGRALINAPKAMIGDTKDFVSGAEMVGRGAWDALKHTGMGIAPFLNRATTTTEPTMGGGRSAVRAGEEGGDGLPTYSPTPDGKPIPPTPLSTNTGSYLTGQQAKLKMPASSKKIRRR